MDIQHHSILTTAGTEYFAQAIATGTPVIGAEFLLAVGDGDGQQYEPDTSQTNLVAEKWRGKINDIYTNENDASQIIVEGIVPTSVGGWFIREWGVYNKEGVLIAVGSMDDTYKSVISSGIGKQIIIQAILDIDNAAVLELIIDGNVVVASKKYVDDLDKKHRADLASIDGGRQIGLQQGGSVQDALSFRTPSMAGAKGDGVRNDTAELQAIINSTAADSITIDYAGSSEGAVSMVRECILNKVYRITGPIIIDATKVRLGQLGGAGIFVDPTGNYPNGYAIKVTGAANLAAYHGHVAAIFNGVHFYSYGRSVDVFYVENAVTNSNNNGSALHNIIGCSFRGFREIFTHGVGGWGWNWFGCQVSNCDTWMNLRKKNDTYERHSFDSCIFQNGGVAFIIDNVEGKVYWHKGSIDYCIALAHISAGHIESNGHHEFSARTTPLVKITGQNASASISGTLFIRNNTASEYYMFEQYNDNQVDISNLFINSDGINLASGRLSNFRLNKRAIALRTDAARYIAYNSADERQIDGSVIYPDYSLSETTYHSVSFSNGELVVQCSGSGVPGYLFIDIPIAGNEYIAFKVTARNTSENGKIFLEKKLLSLNKREVADFSSSGTTVWAPGGASALYVNGGSMTVFKVDKSAGFLRTVFNLAQMHAGDMFIVSSLSTFRF
ncbi:phage tail protein [Serratia sp. PL7]|uniref:phage tail protein n=1 Tax=Serratia sp. PL7 TaxID=2952201 RepID=UPI0021AD8CD0|nr:phage tail protein [Serratia sp. PL7]